MMQRQRKQRAALLHKARALVCGSTRKHNGQEGAMEVDAEAQPLPGKRRGGSGARRRRRYADELVEPEWLMTAPHDLFLNSGEDAPVDTLAGGSTSGRAAQGGGSLEDDDEPGWYVLPRPEGKRCLMVAHNGRTVTQDKNGIRVHQFQSILPNGSQMTRTGGGSDAYSIFDCVFNQDLCTYIITDLLCWKGQSLYGCTASLRFHWARVRLEETGISVSSEASLRASGGMAGMMAMGATDEDMGEEYGIVLAPSFLSTKESVYRCLTDSFGYQADGVLFVARGGYYEPGELPSPLMLVWKNENVSRYFRRAARAANIPAALGTLCNDGAGSPAVLSLGVTLKCSDERQQIMTTREGVQMLCAQTIAFGSEAQGGGEAAGGVVPFPYRLNRLYKFEVFYGRSHSNEGVFYGIYRGNGPKRRVHPDMHSRIMFHFVVPKLL
eukprot:g5062.t1